MNQARLSAVLVVVVLATIWPATLRAGPSEANEIKLKPDTLNDIATVVTPRKIQWATALFNIQGGEGTLRVAGATVTVKAAIAGAGRLLGVDGGTGDGKTDAGRATAPVSPDATAAFKVPISVGGQKRDIALFLSNLSIPEQNGKITFISGRFFLASCYRGVVNGVAVRLVDDNLDGKIAQDGTDAILIGTSPVAQPLRKTHQIGNAFFELKVAEDGSTLAYSKVTDLKTGVVDSTLLRSSAVAGMVMYDKENGRVVDFVTSKAAVPAGTYTLLYGIVPNGKDVVQILPTANTPAYEVQADMINTLRMGTPLRLNYQASLVGNEIKITPNLSVQGTGNEVYAFDWRGISQPQIAMMDGTRVLAKDAIGYG